MKPEIIETLNELEKRFNLPKQILSVIALNESSGNPDAKPYFEKTWKYFTDAKGNPLTIKEQTVEACQAKAKKILGDVEFDFQVHAHGLLQTVGSVLREIGYLETYPPKDVYTMAYFASKHLQNLRNQFFKKFKKEPTLLQLCGMYNGGFGSATENGNKEYVSDYINKSTKNLQTLKG